MTDPQELMNRLWELLKAGNRPPWEARVTFLVGWNEAPYTGTFADADDYGYRVLVEYNYREIWVDIRDVTQVDGTLLRRD